MKKILSIILVSLVLFLGVAGLADARTTSVRGYIKPSTGRYVAPHYRTSPNSYKWDNYSTKGNINPYTGKKGYGNPLKW
jgi:hypothetical protein